MEEIKIYHRLGEVYLLSDEMDLKIDTNRRIYIKKHTDKEYVFTNIMINNGYKKKQKELYLLTLRQGIIQNFNKSPNKNFPTKEEDEVEELEENNVEKQNNEVRN